MPLDNPPLVLDRNQLREITLNDADLMREILAALIEDTSKQIHLLDLAIREGDGPRCMRLAHYSKGACANAGANQAAVLLARIERQAAAGAVKQCGLDLAALVEQIEKLRDESRI